MDAVLEISRIIVPPLITVGLGAYVAQRFFVSRANEGAMVDFMVRTFANSKMMPWNTGRLPQIHQRTSNGKLYWLRKSRE